MTIIGQIIYNWKLVLFDIHLVNLDIPLQRSLILQQQTMSCQIQIQISLVSGIKNSGSFPTLKLGIIKSSFDIYKSWIY